MHWTNLTVIIEAKYWVSGRLKDVKTSYQNWPWIRRLCSNRWLKMEVTVRQKKKRISGVSDEINTFTSLFSQKYPSRNYGWYDGKDQGQAELRATGKRGGGPHIWSWQAEVSGNATFSDELGAIYSRAHHFIIIITITIITIIITIIIIIIIIVVVVVVVVIIIINVIITLVGVDVISTSSPSSPSSSSWSLSSSSSLSWQASSSSSFIVVISSNWATTEPLSNTHFRQSLPSGPSSSFFVRVDVK